MKQPTLFPWLASALLALTGCAGPKTHYPGAEAQQRLAAAEAESDTAQSASVDTQANYLKVVEQMQRNGLWFASLAHIDALEQRWGAAPESTRMRADALRHTGQATASADMYRRLLATPLAAAGHHGLGLLAGGRGEFPEAVRQLEAAQQRNPTDALLLSDLGYARLRAGRIDDARVPLMQALQLRPDNAQVQANAALYLEASRQHAQAEALMDAHRMPDATRSAIREAARQLGGAPAPVALLDTAATSPGSPASESAPPLALRTAMWPGMRRAQAGSPEQPATPAAVISRVPASRTSSSGETQ